MAIYVSTGDGHALLEAIYAAIDDNKIRTWCYADHDGVRYLTHSADQWNQKAWLKATVQQPGLVFNIVKPKGSNISTEVYAVYHGRLIEMLLAHFDGWIATAAATSMPTALDVVKAA
jgi:hypothetical protein